MLTAQRILIFFLLVECQYVILYPIDQYYEDLGQCIPIKCIDGVPPENCTSLCNSANFKTTCRPRTNFCLCLKPVGNGRMDLVSPDEVPTLFKQIDSSSEAYKDNQTDSSSEAYKDNQTDSSSETYSATFFAFFTYIIPISDLDTADKNETTHSEKMEIKNNEVMDKDKENTEREELLNEIVNVHEGRLFWDFCYILTGLLLLMVGLILYEIYMCRKMANSGQPNGVEPLINTDVSNTIFTVGNEKKTNAQKITQ